MLYFLIFTITIKFSMSDIEYLINQDDDNNFIYGDFLINNQFYNCSDNAAKLWDYFKVEIDANKDDLIDQEEFKTFLMRIIQIDRKEETNELIKKLDPNRTGYIEFSSYANETFGSGLLEILSEPGDHMDNLSELKVLYNLERNKWFNLSSGDLLNYTSFYEFLFVDESPRLRDLEKEIYFRSYDTDGDGYLSLNEFSVAIKDYDDTIASTNRFTNKIDLNGDNRLDLHEFKKWFLVPNKEKLIDEERNYIFKICDLNGDNFLEKAEVEKTCEKLAKNQLIVNRKISLNQNQTLLRHDEL